MWNCERSDTVNVLSLIFGHWGLQFRQCTFEMVWKDFLSRPLIRRWQPFLNKSGSVGSWSAPVRDVHVFVLAEAQHRWTQEGTTKYEGQLQHHSTDFQDADESALVCTRRGQLAGIIFSWVRDLHLVTSHLNLTQVGDVIVWYVFGRQIHLEEIPSYELPD